MSYTNPVSISDLSDLHACAGEALASLLAARSKHSAYQALHPWVGQLLGEVNWPFGKSEAARLAYMQSVLPFSGRGVLDIGANTGYFSFGALEHGSPGVVAVEGNQKHADFILQAAQLLGLNHQLRAEHSYFDFDKPTTECHDVVLCLNVLHHLGDDFGAQGQDMAAAKQSMGVALRRLAQQAEHCWFQLGFNWKGDRYKPLFDSGLKSELIDFVTSACGSAWHVKHVAIFDPQFGQFSPSSPHLLKRMNNIGEFLNRPLFLLKRS